MKSLLLIAISSLVLFAVAYTKPANAGQQVVTVCDPNCHQVVIITTDGIEDGPVIVMPL